MNITPTAERLLLEYKIVEIEASDHAVLLRLDNGVVIQIDYEIFVTSR